MRRHYVIVGWIITTIAVVFMVGRACNAIASSDLPHRIALGPLLLTVTLQVVGFALGGLGWRLVVGGLSAGFTSSEAVAIVMVSQVGKYLPSNLGHLVGRVGMTRMCGVPIITGTLALGIEIAVTLLSGTMICGIGLIIRPDLVANARLGPAATLLGAGMLICGSMGVVLLVTPRRFRRLVPRPLRSRLLGLPSLRLLNLLGALLISSSLFGLMALMVTVISMAFPQVRVGYDTALLAFTVA